MAYQTQTGFWPEMRADRRHTEWSPDTASRKALPLVGGAPWPQHLRWSLKATWDCAGAWTTGQLNYWCFISELNRNGWLAWCHSPWGFTVGFKDGSRSGHFEPLPVVLKWPYISQAPL